MNSVYQEFLQKFSRFLRPSYGNRIAGLWRSRNAHFSGCLDIGEAEPLCRQIANVANCIAAALISLFICNSNFQ